MGAERIRRTLVAGLLGFALVAVPALAPGSSAGDDDRQALRPQPELAGLLAPWAGQWTQLDPATRARLEHNARRWLQLDVEERAELVARLEQWESLPAAERAARRATRQAWQALPEHDRAAIAAAARHYAQADAAQQAAWREAFEAQDLAAQRSWVLGPTTGSWLQSVRPLFAFVPADEREASLALLSALDESARADLKRLVPRLPPAEREAFRRRLIDTDPGERAGLIRQRLGE